MILHLIFLPAHTSRVGPGRFTLRDGEVITTDAALAPAVRPWMRRLEGAFGLGLALVVNDADHAHTGAPRPALSGRCVPTRPCTGHLNSQRRIDYAAFPRLVAFAEVAWSPQRDRAPGSAASMDFLELLARHVPRLDAAGIEYRPMAGPLPWQKRPGVPGSPRDLADETARTGWEGAGGWREAESIDPLADS